MVIQVWVVVLNWRNAADTVECLESVIKFGGLSVAGIVLCDNDSGDDSVSDVRDWATSREVSLLEYVWQGGTFVAQAFEQPFGQDVGVNRVHLVHTGGNLGFAGGNNVGIEFVRRHESYDFIFLLNNDAQLDDGTVDAMCRRFDDPRIGMCGATVRYFHTRDKVQARGGATYWPALGRARHIGAGQPASASCDPAAVEARLDYILGAALMISRECIESIGIMDERYFLYYEEIDWATRAQRQGFTLGFAPAAVVYHKEGGTIGSSSNTQKRSALSQYYLFRSRILFTRKFYPYFLPTAALFSLAQLMRSAIGRDFRRVSAGLRGVFGLPSPEDSSP